MIVLSLELITFAMSGECTMPETNILCHDIIMIIVQVYIIIWSCTGIVLLTVYDILFCGF